MPPKSKAAKAKAAAAKLKNSSSSGSISAAASSSSSSSSASSSSTADKPQVKDSYRNCTGVLISQPRALDVKVGGFTLAAYGKELIKDTMIELTIGRRYGLIGSNGSGKCFAAGTKLRRLDGQEVAVQDVQAGDELMGDDSTARIVTPGSLTHSRAVLYEISPHWAGATAFTVNADHILVLRITAQPRVEPQGSSADIGWSALWFELDTANRMQLQRRAFSSQAEAQQAVSGLLQSWQPLEWEVSVQDFLSSPAEVRAACHLFQSGPVTFQSSLPSLQQVLSVAIGSEATEAQLAWAAWYLGHWLSAGVAGDSAVTAKTEVVQRLLQYQALFGEQVECQPNVSGGVSVVRFGAEGRPAVARGLLVAYSLLNNPHIPQAWLSDTIHVRHVILAGILDGCGQDVDDGCYSLAAPSHSAAAAFKLLAGSLGLRSSVITKQPLGGGLLSLSGQLSEVALHCASSAMRQSSAATEKAGEDSRCYGFSVTQQAEGDYYGFAVHGGANRRFLLADFTVTHNSAFLKCLAAREVPIPDHIDIFLLEEEVAAQEKTPIEVVIGEVQEEMKRLESEAERVLEEDGPESELLQDIYTRLDSMDPSTFEVRAGKLLFGLGFTPELMKKMTKDLSGGWRMRVALAKALFIKPSLLLLDEPTNHLDLEACVWLENYLAGYDRCLVVVSHSQDFLNSVCTNIIHITLGCKLAVYTGNYDQFITTKAELEVNQMKKFTKEQDDIRHIKQFIASCGTYSNLVRQAKSKQKIIDKMEADGLTEEVKPPPVFNFHFSDCEKLPPPILSFENVSFAYSGQLRDALYTQLNLGLDSESRVALVGPNGAGKSTLLKLMIGELQPTEGAIRKHLHVTIGRYNQHSNDQLDPKLTVLDFIRASFPEKKMEEQEWRSHIGRYGLGGTLQKTLIGQLSDGMKSRVVFCMLAIARPNLLLLDEPTNHLDMECIDSLARAIAAFQGGVVLVSHDFRLISQVAKQIWVCDKKTISIWKGDIRSYKNSLVLKVKRAEEAFSM